MTYKTNYAKALTGLSAISTILLTAKEQTLEVLLIRLLAKKISARSGLISDKCCKT